MRLNRILALALVTLCFIAALGNWLGGSVSKSKSPGSANVALINVYGVISDESSGGAFSSGDGANANKLIQSIKNAREDEGIKAILLRINSPGGTAAASQAVYEELMRTRNDSDIKIIASLGDVAASGGYYIASAADHIVANPSSITGSIGVIVRTQNVSSLMDKIGVQTNTIQSGPLKDILSPFRETKPEERKILQGVVDESYQQFLDAIVAGREMSLDKLKPLADGRIFTGTQAKEKNLVDSLGNYYDALKTTAELANISGEPSVRDFGKSSFFGDLGPFLSQSYPPLPTEWISSESQWPRWYKIPLTIME
ncbi:signal peptide peptidase SppA [Acaryochloris sp. IP29b_bin.137]|uniref:signal peptide peptidase SppA n=1 Tax=Acaryochloris sp. IP29b_bin.137 TaxID=2969217 RepID=UPI002629A926|nr:signal peptide peptidase SppA [Acaryochloris sp. IP29b_bin.137]